MATAKIAAVIQSVPAKKESLRKAFEVLQSYSSSLSSFTLEWKDIDGHFSAIEKSIEESFEDLQAKETEKSAAAAVEEKPAPAPAAVAAAVEEKSVPAKASAAAELESYPRPVLLSLCAKMDGKGLRSYICDNCKEIHAIRSELNPALRAAPDPALLVLDALDDFYSPMFVSEKDGPNQGIRRTCVNLLERLQAVAPEIKPAVRERAKKLATEWRGKICDSGTDNSMEAIGFLQLLVSYGLASEFKVDDLLDLLVLVSGRTHIINLCKNLGLTENVPDLIQKLSNKGKQLEVVKIVYAFNLLDKFPPVPLLKSYMEETEGNYFTQNEAIGKEVGALKSTLKAVEESKLESDYPREILQNRIAQLQQHKSAKKKHRGVKHRGAKKRTALAADVSNSKTQQQQRTNKRPRPHPSSITSAPAVAGHHFPQPQSQLGLMDRSPYLGMGGAGPYGSLYNHAGSNLSGAPMGPDGNRSLYDRPAATYSGYSLSGRPPSYTSSLYP